MGELYASIEFEQSCVGDDHKEVSLEGIYLNVKLTCSIDNLEHFFIVCASEGGFLHMLATILLYYY